MNSGCQLSAATQQFWELDFRLWLLPVCVFHLCMFWVLVISSVSSLFSARFPFLHSLINVKLFKS